MKMNLKILALFAFSTFAFAQASERIQNVISSCKNKASSVLEFAKNNKKKTALRVATGLYAVYLFKPTNTISTLKKATFINGKDNFKKEWLPEDKYTIFGANEQTYLGKKIAEQFPVTTNCGFGPLSHLAKQTSKGQWLIFLLAFLADKKMATN